MERNTLNFEKPKNNMLELFIMFGDYGLPERSHKPERSLNEEHAYVSCLKVDDKNLGK